MKNELIKQLSTDLKISFFKYESEESFYSRLIYSALSDWMKMCILDRTNEKHVDCKSKSYIRIRCEEILQDFLRIFPECRDYFYKNSDNNENHPINVLRNKMIVNMELIYKSGNIYLPKGIIQSINPNYSRILGIDGMRKKSHGITKLVNNIEEKAIEKIPFDDCDDFYKVLFKNIKWEPFNDYSIIEVLDPNSTISPYKSWKDVYVMDEYEVYLSKIEINPTQKEYFWIKKDNNSILISKINEYYVLHQEIRRFILWQRKKHNCPIALKYQTDGNYTAITFFAQIPLREQNILDTYGWPKDYIQNKFGYIFSNDIWAEIKNMLVDLNFELEEDDYGRI